MPPILVLIITAYELARLSNPWHHNCKQLTFFRWGVYPFTVKYPLNRKTLADFSILLPIQYPDMINLAEWFHSNFSFVYFRRKKKHAVSWTWLVEFSHSNFKAKSKLSLSCWLVFASTNLCVMWRQSLVLYQMYLWSSNVREEPTNCARIITFLETYKDKLLFLVKKILVSL